MYAPHPQPPTPADRPTYTLTPTAAFAALPLVFVAVLAFPVATLGFLAGVVAALAVNR